MLLAGFIARRWVLEVVVDVGRVGECRRILYRPEVARLLLVVKITRETSGVVVPIDEAIKGICDAGLRRHTFGILPVLRRHDRRARWKHNKVNKC